MPHKGYKQKPEVIEKRRLAQINKKHKNVKGWTHQGKRFIMHGGKEMLEHRVIMELHVGRPLERHEVVHHIDKNPLNNNIENLQLMTKSSHSIFHNTGKIRKGQATESSKRRVSEWTKNAWKNGVFDNRPPMTEETKQKISNSIKKIRASRFWSTRKHHETISSSG